MSCRCCSYFWQAWEFSCIQDTGTKNPQHFIFLKTLLLEEKNQFGSFLSKFGCLGRSDFPWHLLGELVELEKCELWWGNSWSRAPMGWGQEILAGSQQVLGWGCTSLVLFHYFLKNFKLTLSVNSHITSTSVQPSDLQDSLLLRVGSVKTKHWSGQDHQ